MIILLSYIYSLFVFSNTVDLLFYISLIIKIVIGIILANILHRSPKSLIYWIIFQFIFILLTNLSEDFYKFALLFISSASNDTFSQLYGVKALGFGLYHAEGAVIFVLMVLFAFFMQETKKVFMNRTINFSYFLSFSSLLVARTAIIPLLIFSFFKKPISLMVLLLFLFIILLNINIENEKVIYLLEIFYSLIEKGEIVTSSTNQNLEMIILPNSFEEYIYGVGHFFNTEEGFSSGYYMNTDLGWIRLLLFGGIFFVVLFLVINIYWTILSLNTTKGYFFKLFFIIVYIVITMKGLYSLVFFSVLIFYYTKLVNKEFFVKKIEVDSN